MNRPLRILLLVVAYWGSALLVTGMAAFLLGDCGTGPKQNDLEACLAEKDLIYRIGLGLALVGFPYLLWRLIKEKGPL